MEVTYALLIFPLSEYAAWKQRIHDHPGIVGLFGFIARPERMSILVAEYQPGALESLPGRTAAVLEWNPMLAGAAPGEQE